MNWMVLVMNLSAYCVSLLYRAAATAALTRNTPDIGSETIIGYLVKQKGLWYLRQMSNETLHVQMPVAICRSYYEHYLVDVLTEQFTIVGEARPYDQLSCFEVRRRT